MLKQIKNIDIYILTYTYKHINKEIITKHIKI